jgi:hypothetical protein
MEKIFDTIKHFWTDHKVIAGVVILVVVIVTIF